MTDVSVDPESLAGKLRFKLSFGSEVFQTVEGLWGISVLENKKIVLFLNIATKLCCIH